MHRIIIVGGGAGGLELATRLGEKFSAKSRHERAQITLVDRNPTHVWKPLLHEVAAGSMNPHAHQLEYIAQAYWHGFRFEQGSLSAIDRKECSVCVDALIDSEGLEVLPARKLAYDTLVIAVGSNTNFFSVEDTEKYAPPAGYGGSGGKFRQRLISAVMRADVASRNRGMPGQVNIAIVGGGATGVELAAELRAASDVLAAYGLHRLDPHKDIRITLIDSGNRILPALSERVSNAATKIIWERSVDVMVSERVTEVMLTELRTVRGKHIAADITVWTAGIKAPAVLCQLDGLEVNASGQLIVRSTLQTARDDNIFAFGDCAACAIPGSERNVPPRAQAAHQQASFLVKAITRLLEGKPLPHFQYHNFVSLVSLGHESAVGSLMGGLAAGALFIGDIAARVMYTSLYRMHLAALHGWPRTLVTPFPTNLDPPLRLISNCIKPSSHSYLDISRRPAAHDVVVMATSVPSYNGQIPRGLERNLTAFALVKASSVIVLVDFESSKISAQNCIAEQSWWSSRGRERRGRDRRSGRRPPGDDPGFFANDKRPLRI